MNDQTSEARPNQEERPNRDAADQPGGPSNGTTARQPRRWPLYALGAFLAVAAIIGGITWYLTRNQISTDDAFTDGRAIMVAPKINGTVISLNVTDNQRVHQGDLLVQIDPRDYTTSRDQAQGAVQVAQAQLASAEAALAKARVDFPAQLLSAQAQLASAQAAETRAESDDRRQRAVSSGATSQQQIDTASAALLQTRAEVGEMQAQLAQAELVQANIDQAEAQVRQLDGQRREAEAQLAQAELNLSYTRVVAPQDGWVTRRNVESGDQVQTGTPILALVAPDIWVTANFKEDQLARMRPGQPVSIAVDAYPALKLSGHVDSVQMGSGSRFTAFPAENATGNYVKIVQRVPVKILIDRGLPPDQALPLGLSVEPTVTVR